MDIIITSGSILKYSSPKSKLQNKPFQVKFYKPSKKAEKNHWWN